MGRGIVFDYSTIVSVLEDDFLWFKHWAVRNGMGSSFDFQNANSFGKFYRSIFKRDWNIKSVYDELGLPYDPESEEFKKQKNGL